MTSFSDLDRLLAGHARADVVCPVCSPSRKPEHRALRTLRLWRLQNTGISIKCVHCGEQALVYPDRDHRPDPAELDRQRREIEAARRRDEADRRRRIHSARRIFDDAVAIAGTPAERYLVCDRGLIVPRDCDDVLRFSYRCPWPSGEWHRAMICAFRPIDVERPPDRSTPVVGVHRIRGRGHERKRMLGPAKGCAVQFGQWVPGIPISICEGIETAVAVCSRLPAIGSPV